MIQELVYTSAPRGLKPGSRGFCTVQSTAGMARNLAERLESLSGYRHLFAAKDQTKAQGQSTNQNPVAHSHLILSVGGQQFHVLSRICDAGLDYTQRSNKLAHHVVIDSPAQLPPAGPAWLLAQPGVMSTQWNGEPQVTPPNRTLPHADLKPALCQSWAQVTGDAGWGGVLAATAASSQRDLSAAVIYEPGTDVLSLVGEALALLPPEQRWQVTFSTYFAKLPPDVRCRWRFYVASTPEAARVRRSPQTVVIDLTRKLSVPEENAYTAAAREGTFAAPPERKSPATQGQPSPVSNALEVAGEYANSASDAGGLAAEGYGVKPKSPPPLTGPVAHRRRRSRDMSEYDEPSNKKWKVLAGVACLAILGMAGVLIYTQVMQGGDQAIAASGDDKDLQASNATMRPERGIENAADITDSFDKPIEGSTTNGTPADEIMRGDGGNDDAPIDRELDDPPTPNDAASTETTTRPVGAEKHTIAELPAAIEETIDAVNLMDGEFVSVAASAQPESIQLLGLTDIHDGRKLEFSECHANPDRFEWTLRRSLTSSYGASGGTPLATIQLTRQGGAQIGFKWLVASKEDCWQLDYCALLLTFKEHKPAIIGLKRFDINQSVALDGFLSSANDAGKISNNKWLQPHIRWSVNGESIAPESQMHHVNLDVKLQQEELIAQLEFDATQITAGIITKTPFKQFENAGLDQIVKRLRAREKLITEKLRASKIELSLEDAKNRLQDLKQQKADGDNSGRLSEQVDRLHNTIASTQPDQVFCSLVHQCLSVLNELSNQAITCTCTATFDNNTPDPSDDFTIDLATITISFEAPPKLDGGKKQGQGQPGRKNQNGGQRP